MISKELLSAVLGINIIETSQSNTQKGFINYWYDENRGNYINIYELAHKCKEWAKTKGWYVTSWIPMSGENGGVEFGHSVKNIKERLIFADTETEAIFKACEWIMEQKATI